MIMNLLISRFIENYYSDRRKRDSQNASIELLRKKYEKEKLNLEKRIHSLETQIDSIKVIESRREKGEMILSNINLIRKGMDKIIIKNSK